MNDRHITTHAGLRNISISKIIQQFRTVHLLLNVTLPASNSTHYHISLLGALCDLAPIPYIRAAFSLTPLPPLIIMTDSLKTHTDKRRLMWLDSMKAVGLYFIVAGHYFPPGYEFLYVFSVQLFFIISGFLNKKVNFTLFVKKLTRQLILPMLLLSLMLIFINNLNLLRSGNFSVYKILNDLFRLIIGEQAVLGGLWFVYTLIIVKIIAQLPSVRIKALFAIIFLFIAFLYNNYCAHTIKNCWLNVLLAYPMFFLGEISTRYKHQINNIISKSLLLCLLIAGITGVALCGIFNSPVWMYRCLYGDSMTLFILGSISGTIMVFAFSKLFLDIPCKIIQTISDGSIIILAFHMYFVFIGLHYPIGYGYYPEAALIMALFIPIIRLCQQYFPILLGYRGVNNLKQSNLA